MGVLDKIKDTFGYESVDSKRTANNKKVLDVLSVEDDMNKFIREDAANDHETNRLVHVLFRQMRQRNSEIRTQLELFLDSWAFQHGGITKDNFRDAVRAVVKYAENVRKRANAKMEAAEFRTMQGSLGDGFDDEPFQGLPDDAAFEQAIVRQQKRKS